MERWIPDAGERVRLTKETIDEETGLHFPPGSPGEVSGLVDGVSTVEVELDTSIADDLDSGNCTWVIVEIANLRSLE